MPLVHGQICNWSFNAMTNTPTARAASRIPLTSASFGRNSGLAALDNTISAIVDIIYVFLDPRIRPA